MNPSAQIASDAELAERPHAFGESLRIAIGCVLAWLFARTFLVLGMLMPCRVEGDSMAPTLSHNQRMVVDRTVFWFRSPRRWEVVVFPYPEAPRALCIKRIVGLPGERLIIRDGQAFADGQPLNPPHDLRYGPRSGQELGDSPEYILGPDEYFVLGDNSMASIDSRSWEPPAVRGETLIGRSVGHHP